MNEDIVMSNIVNVDIIGPHQDIDVDSSRVAIPTTPIVLPNIGSAVVQRDEHHVWATVTFDDAAPPLWEWETRIVQPIRDAMGV